MRTALRTWAEDVYPGGADVAGMFLASSVLTQGGVPSSFAQRQQKFLIFYYERAKFDLSWLFFPVIVLYLFDTFLPSASEYGAVVGSPEWSFLPSAASAVLRPIVVPGAPSRLVEHTAL